MSTLTWARGRKKLTPEERVKSDQRQKNRIKVANLVARNDNIDKTCCVCGKPGRILHNNDNPYYISFICNECAKDENKKKQAILKRKDIRTMLNKRGISTKTISEKEIQSIVENFKEKNKTKKLTVGNYCLKLGITRYQFTKIIDRYVEITNDTQIYNTIAQIKKQNRKKGR